MRQRRAVLLMTRELGLGGSERQLCETAKALDPAVFEAHVGCFRPDGLRAGELRAAGVPIAVFPVRSFVSASTFAAARELASYTERHRIALVHTFDVPSNLFGVPAARLAGVPLVLSSQRAHRDLLRRRSRHLIRLIDQMVDAVVVNSQAIQRHLVAEERVPPGRIRLCYNGVDIGRFHPGPRTRPAALADASLVIGVVCAFRPEKGLGTLLEAFARLRPADRGLKLVLVGGGPLRDDLQAHAARLGLIPDCHFEPATADVPAWLQAIDVFVLPSLSEALSNSLMEAMACGCCAVASDTGGNPELVIDGETGLLFPPGDSASLAVRLERLVAQPCLRERLAAQGCRFIHENFSLAASVRRMEEIYAELLDRQHL